MVDAWFGDQILTWYDKHGRKALPWKDPKSAYSIWLSEIMLQQTQVATVIPYFKKFIKVFPTVEALAKASLDEVIALWAGLGYYARARNLHKTAQILVEKWQSQLPNDVMELEKLPGIGRSTAAAIVAQSYDKRAPILEGNVKRVLCRFYGIPGWPGLKTVQEKLWILTEQVTPFERPNDYTQGIMDMGALLCKRSSPNCPECPLKLRCVAFNQNKVNHYPEARPSQVKPIKQAVFIILLNQNFEVLLMRRPPKGIWGGLWCLPELVDLENLKLSFKHLSKKSVRRHTFTHYHLDYESILAYCNISPNNAQVLTPKVSQKANQNDQKDQKNIKYYEQTYFWYTLSDSEEIGLPAPHKVLMTELIAQLQREKDESSYC